MHTLSFDMPIRFGEYVGSFGLHLMNKYPGCVAMAHPHPTERDLYYFVAKTYDLALYRKIRKEARIFHVLMLGQESSAWEG